MKGWTFPTSLPICRVYVDFGIWHEMVTSTRLKEQAGNGISRRQTLSSKIAQGLQSVKYSLLQSPKNPKGATN